jgi:thioredoxin reductase
MAQCIKTNENKSKTKYCCITCGAEADELSHHYNEGVIKIIHCVREDINIK